MRHEKMISGSCRMRVVPLGVPTHTTVMTGFRFYFLEQKTTLNDDFQRNIFEQVN